MNNEMNEFDLRVEQKKDLRKAKKEFSRIGFGYLIFSGLSIVVSLVIQIAVLSANEEFYYSHLFLNLVTPVSMYLFALPVLIAFLRGVKPMPPEKRRIGFGEIVSYFAVGFGLMYIGAYMGNGLMAALSGVTGNDYTNGLDAVVNGNMWVTGFFVVVVAPIGEEFVFRKLLIDRTGKYGCFISALLSGVIFGLMHGNFYQFFYAAMLGFLLGYVYMNTGRIWLCIAIHSVINFFGSVFTTLMSDALAELLEMNYPTVEQMIDIFAEKWLWIVLMLLFNVVVYSSIACAIVLPLVFRNKLRFGRGEIDIPRSERFSTVFINVGMICMIVFYVIEITLSLMP